MGHYFLDILYDAATILERIDFDFYPFYIH